MRRRSSLSELGFLINLGNACIMVLCAWDLIIGPKKKIKERSEEQRESSHPPITGHANRTTVSYPRR